ncbi:hypothetical protein CDD83_2818 [Cordyceps sp. RAO-2017]|nr:hypothetical protein CDD83_2818 [Cordyceps sp. RAO-2017]
MSHGAALMARIDTRETSSRVPFRIERVMQDSHPSARVQKSRESGSTTSKIRDSCHACALSKVRCPKEKPICSRCEKRSTACEYFVTKRPGRKRHNSQVAYNNNTISVGGSALAEEDVTDRQSPSSRSSIPPALTPSSPAGHRSGAGEVSCYTDIFADLLTPLDPPLTPGMSGARTHFHDLLTPSMNFLDLESLDPNLSNYVHGHHDIAELLTSEDTDPEPSSVSSSLACTIPSKPCSPVSDRPALSFRREIVAAQSGSMGCCMGQALDLMNSLFSSEDTSSSSFLQGASTASNIAAHNGNSSIEKVVAQNKQSIAVANKMLQCPCQKTGYLTATLSMIVFKILERYAAAARYNPDAAGFEKGESRLSGSRRPGLAKGGYPGSPNDGGAKRMTAQLILSELHRVQGLVNKLAPRLNAQGKGVNPDKHPQTMASECFETTTGSFSANTLGQMETDLRKRLAALSSEIISVLRYS